jgi:hypothetical protein
VYDEIFNEIFSRLDKMQVKVDHFWTNDDGYKVIPEHCFDTVSITSDQTVRFMAYSSTPANIDKAQLEAYI